MLTLYMYPQYRYNVHREGMYTVYALTTPTLHVFTVTNMLYEHVYNTYGCFFTVNVHVL